MRIFKLKRFDTISLAFILFISFLTVADLFINTGKAANGDGLVHTVMGTMFAQAIKAGQFPVGWIDGFANYGYPLGSVAQQLTTYLVAIFTLITNNPSLSFNIVAFLGALLSNIFFYIFLRLYFSSFISFAGIILFNFSPYRILNIYIRGALPEYFAEVFIPLLLISAYFIFKKRSIYGFFLLSISLCLLALTHPFMLIVSMFIFIPYVIFLLYESGFNKAFLLRYISIFLTGIIIGLGIASYYILPLSAEIKYFYYGQAKNHLTPNNFLSIQNYFFNNWFYFYDLDIFNRGFYVNAGLVESFMVIAGFAYLVFMFIKKRRRVTIFSFAVITSILVIFMTTSFAAALYNNISLLSNIQFPWRFLSVFIFLPPIIYCYILKNIRRRKIIVLGLNLAVVLIIFPQLYGKNYRADSLKDYLFTPYNLHAVVMNPVWTGRSEDYPIKPKKWSIIEGVGNVAVKKLTNQVREYRINANTPLRMADFTFYFPGWNAYIDGKVTNIEYQDPQYRGVITYIVPQGSYTVVLKYEDTRIRRLGKIFTLIFFTLFVSLFLFRNKLQTVLLNPI